MIKRINIYDCDGILLDSLHRYKIGENGKIDLAHWRKYDKREYILKDKPSVLAEHYKKALANPEIFVIIATARACEYNDSNYEHIFSTLGRPNAFIHRQGANDNRGGAELKLDGILPILAHKKGASVHVYEDNSDYLRDLCHAIRDAGFKTVGHFNPSHQGH